MRASLLYQKNKKKLLATAILAVALTSIGMSAKAAIIVHDPKVYVQIVKQIQKATEMVNNLKKQIDLQVQNLQSLQKKTVDPILKDVASYKNEYNALKKDVNSLLSGSKKAADSYKDIFKDISKIDVKTADYRSLQGAMEVNNMQVEKFNVEATTLINQLEKELAASNTRVEKLQKEILNAKGAKDLAQLNNLISAESVHAQNITNKINAIRSKQEAVASQVQKMDKDASKALLEKTAADFDKAAKELKVAPRMVESQTETFYKLVEKEGWK